MAIRSRRRRTGAPHPARPSGRAHLAGIRTILEILDAGVAPCGHVERLLAGRLEGIDRQIAELHRLRATVAALHRAAAEAEPGSCAPETICRYL